MTAAVELGDEPVDDPLRPAVRPRWHTLERRGDLGDAERTSHGTEHLWGKEQPRGPPGGILAAKFRTPGQLPGWEGQYGRSAGLIRVGLLGLFLGLVAGTGTAGRTNGATDDRAGRSGDGATDERAGRCTAEGARARTGLVVALRRLTGDRATDGADRATDDCARGSTDGHTDGGAAEGAGSGTHGLRAAFLVLGSRATALVQEVVIVRMIVRGSRVVVHWGPPCFRADRHIAGTGRRMTPLPRR